MRESALQQPPSCYYIRKWEWALAACEDNSTAAELISIFLFHFDNRTANRTLAELVQRAIQKNGRALRELGDWMPYSNAYLRELLLHTWSQNYVKGGLEKLETLGFISLDVPSDIENFYSRSHTWVKLNIDEIQNYIDDVWTPNHPRIPSVYWIGKQDLQTAIDVITGIVDSADFEIPDEATPLIDLEAVEQSDKLKTLVQQINALCAFDKHIHNRNSNFIYDKTRREMMKLRLKERSKTGGIGTVAQAIIGLTFSEWHYATHPDNLLGSKNSQGKTGRIYNDVKYYAENSAKFERALRYAEENDVGISRARTELFAFLDGKGSRFAKKHREMSQEVKRMEADSEEIKPYKSFAHSIVRFFLSDLPVAEIMETVELNTGLNSAGSGLVHPALMVEALTQAAKTYKPQLAASVMEAIQKFADDFCELQELNQ